MNDRIGPFASFNPDMDTYDYKWQNFRQHLLDNTVTTSSGAFPEFMIIGPGRSGSNWVFSSLFPNYNITRKEIHYFTFKWQEESLDKYRHRFECDLAPLKGDFTPWNCLLPQQAIETIYALNPNLKIIYLARNLADHAWAVARHIARARKYSFRLLDGDYSNLSLDMLAPFLLSDFSISTSDHFLAINRWLSVFPKENVQVHFFEEMIENPENYLKKISSFLCFDVGAADCSAQEKCNIGLDLSVPDSAKVLLSTIWRYRTMRTAEMLKEKFGLIVPRQWEKATEQEVLSDDLLIHDDIQNEIYLTGGAKSGLFYNAFKNQSPSGRSNKVICDYPFDAYALTDHTLQGVANHSALDKLRQSRIIEQLKMEMDT